MQEIIAIETLRNAFRPIEQFKAEHTTFNMLTFHSAARNALLAMEIATRIMTDSNVLGRMEPHFQQAFYLSNSGMLFTIIAFRFHSLIGQLGDDKKAELSEDSIKAEAATRFSHISTLQQLLNSPDSPYFRAIEHFTTLKNAQLAVTPPSVPPAPARGPSVAPAA